MIPPFEQAAVDLQLSVLSDDRVRQARQAFTADEESESSSLFNERMKSIGDTLEQAGFGDEVISATLRVENYLRYYYAQWTLDTVEGRKQGAPLSIWSAKRIDNADYVLSDPDIDFVDILAKLMALCHHAKLSKDKTEEEIRSAYQMKKSVIPEGESSELNSRTFSGGPGFSDRFGNRGSSSNGASKSVQQPVDRLMPINEDVPRPSTPGNTLVESKTLEVLEKGHTLRA